jgi:hypothetical protein
VLRDGFAEDPGGHRATILDHGSFDGIDELGVQFFREGHQEGLVDAEAFDTVGGQVVVAGEVLVSHADGGGETTEEEAARFKNSPEVVEHGVEVSVVTGEVEDGAAENQIEGGVWIGDGFDGFDAEVFSGKLGREGGGEGASLCDRVGVLIGREDLIAFAEEIDEIAAGATACVEHAHARVDVVAEDLIEEVDIDGAELLLESEHRFRG